MTIDGPYIFINETVAEAFNIYTDGNNKSISIVKNDIPLRKLLTHPFTCHIDATEDVGNISQFSFHLRRPETFNQNPHQYEQPEKLVAVSDIEGNFYALQSLLLSHKIMDENCNWIFGQNHVVILGDLIDRSYNVMACLWLIYKLEGQAKESGGYVHYLLGNHELMNFNHDYRYVHKKYRISNKGYDLYTSLFSENSVMGQWLLTKNAIEKIGNYLFVHAGISNSIIEANFSIDEINDTLRKALRKRHTSLTDERQNMLLRHEGPLWYRGLVVPDDAPTGKEEDLDAITKHFGVEKVVIGHSIVPTITSYFNHRLFAIDVNQPAKKSDLPVQALLLHQGKEYIIDDKGNRNAL